MDSPEPEVLPKLSREGRAHPDNSKTGIDSSIHKNN